MYLLGIPVLLPCTSVTALQPNIYIAVCASAGNTVRHKKDRILKGTSHLCVTTSKPKDYNRMCVLVPAECSTVLIWLRSGSALIFTCIIHTAFQLSAQNSVVTMVFVRVSIHKRDLHTIEARRAWHLHKDGQRFSSVLVWFSDQV